MSILVIAAHPDDEIIGMGGTLKKLSKTSDITILFLADGITARKSSGHVNVSKYEINEYEKERMNHEIDMRKNDAKRALKILGIEKIQFLDFPDNELDTVPFLKIVKEVEKRIITLKPSTIFTHHFNDLNIDHRFAYESTLTAARPLLNSHVNSIISFEASSSTEWRHPYSFRPNIYVNISKELKLKIRALNQYKKEIRKFPHPRSSQTIESVAKRWGSLYGFEAAEAFELIFTRLKNFNKSFI